MSTKKKRSSRGRPRVVRAGLLQAIRHGEARAAEVIAFRAIRRRTRAKAAARASRVRAVAPRIPDSTRRALGSSASAGVLIAEGDSWFDYPLHDVLKLLEDEYGYDVESVAHKGDRVEEMAYSEGQLDEFARRLEKLLRAGNVPKAILLSGGGNDIAGDGFSILLNHAMSTLPPLNESIVSGVIDVRLRDAYITIVAAISSIAHEYLGRFLPIVMHGYDYPVPDGRGFLGGWGPLPGPWLRPGFREKSYRDLASNTALMKVLIDRFNSMLLELTMIPRFGHVHYLNLRGTLATGANYEKDWGNELHPTGKGFKKVTALFADLIAKV